MRLTGAMLFSALLPQIDMQEKEGLDWGEDFLEPKAQRELRERFEYQGANVPAGAHVYDFAKYRGKTTRERRER